jgi:hypothetical protein
VSNKIIRVCTRSVKDLQRKISHTQYQGIKKKIEVFKIIKYFLLYNLVVFIIIISNLQNHARL